MVLSDAHAIKILVILKIFRKYLNVIMKQIMKINWAHNKILFIEEFIYIFKQNLIKTKIKIEMIN